jgi:hypothetical protein
MTWREITCCRILLLIARIVTPGLQKELVELSAHIQVHGASADRSADRADHPATH